MNRVKTAGESKKETSLRKKALPIYIFSFFMIMPLHAVLPVLPLIRDELHASYSEISFFVASIGIIRLVLAFPSGYLVDRFDKKKMLLFSGYLAGSVSVGMILDSFGFSVPVYVVAGFAAFTLVMIALFIHNRPVDLGAK